MEKRKKLIRDILPLIALFAMVAIIASILIIKKADGRGGDPEAKEKPFYGFTYDGNFENYFDTACLAYDYSGMNDEQFARVCRDIESDLKKYHKLFNIYKDFGEINLAYINAHAGEGPIEVSEELFDFLEYSVELCELTGGEMNIAMGSVLKIWHEYREAAEKGPSFLAIPTEAELRAAAEHTDITKLKLSREDLTVELLDPEMSLDVGAIGKGYAAEKIADKLASKGISGFVLDFGGNLRAVGEKPSGAGWKTGIKDPRGDGYIKYLTVKDTSVVTSGDYQRYHFADGVRYHHIIDPDTLYPAKSFSSVTVITEDSALADGLSTALFCMSAEEARALISRLSESGVKISAVLVTGSGEILEF